MTQSFVIDSLQAILDEQEALLYALEGGTPPYSYAWYTDGVMLGEFGIDVDGLCDGYHEVMVTDAQGCNAVYGWEVLPLESGLLWDDVDCTQQDFDGEVRVVLVVELLLTLLVGMVVALSCWIYHQGCSVCL